VDVRDPRRRTSGALRPLALTALLAAVLTGCTAEVQRGWMPGYEDGQVTDKTEAITSLWVGSWIAALLVGVLVWGLMIWCITVYRKRKDDDVLPVQTRYHVPLEILYTAVPVIMVGVLFFHTVDVMDSTEEIVAEPDVVVEVYAKQWSWDFNYLDEDVWDSGVHVIDVGAPGNPERLPTLYLPVDQRVEFQLRSRDVIHSFWVPAFLYKKDMFPSDVRTFQVTPTRVGTYAGKCAELCGEHHGGMLFNVKVVEQAEYDAHVAELRDRGQIGRLGPELDRNQTFGDDNRPASTPRDGGEDA